VIKRIFVLLWFFLAISASSEIALGLGSQRAAEAHKLYVGSFGKTPGAVCLRNKLLLRLSRTRTIVLVENPTSADAILKGTGAVRLVGHHHSNPRIQYSTSGDVPVYDARMTVVLEDSHGRPIWSGNLKPRFWGSQYVCDNVVNQAARHVSEALR
jgi:hypothetical protein